jgi:hypothetical protein
VPGRLLPIHHVARPTLAFNGIPREVPAVGSKNGGLNDPLFNYPKSFCLVETQIGEGTKESLAFSRKLFSPGEALLRG